jgi:hypothetical protein
LFVFSYSTITSKNRKWEILKIDAYAGICRQGIKKPAYAGMGLIGKKV